MADPDPDYETILLEVDGDGIAWLTFNRPEVRNALNQVMVDEVRCALRTLQRREDVKVLVLLGAGDKAFLGGADISELRDRVGADAFRRINSDLFREIERFPAPTIAAINGYALGGGCEVAAACDLRVCGEGAKFGQPEVGLGIIPGAGATYRLPRLIGLGRARELIFTGRIMGASEALSVGLVNQVVPDAQLREATAEMARSIAANSALAVRLAKASLNAQAQGGTDAWQALESTAQAILFDDTEKRARMSAFLERKQRRSAKAQSGPTLTVRAGGAALDLTYAQLGIFGAADQVADVSTLVPGRSGGAVRLRAVASRVESPPSSFARVLSRCGRFKASLSPELIDRALLVYTLNGRPLPEGKGGPYRLLIEDAPDPCMNIKGVGSLELTAEAGANACKHTEEKEG